MKTLTDELKAKLRSAKSEEEAAALLKDAGVDEPLAGRLWNELSQSREEKELDIDELETVSGGARNVLTEGCAATVEAGRGCVFTDYCAVAFTMYDVYPVSGTCSQCGGAPVYADDVKRYFFCSRCGCRMDRYGNVIHEAKQGDFPDFKF